jgi:lysophospholipid acyltransferase (LPLAT)-like uncharacterized protein
MVRWVAVELVYWWLRSLRFKGGCINEAEVALVGCWHRDLPASLGFCKALPMLVFISESNDGAWASAVAKRLGFAVVRGSSSKGSLNIRKVVRKIMNEGFIAGMALDGPKGPAGIIKPGTPWLAKQLKPKNWVRLEFRYGFSVRLNTWDCMVLPLPFTKVEVELMRE